MIPTTTRFPDIVFEALQLCPQNKEGVQFRSNGIAYPVKTIAKQYQMFRIHCDVKVMARYADVVTVAFTDFVAHVTPTQVKNQQEKAKLTKPLVIANLAYLSIYAQQEELRVKFLELLTSLLIH